MKQILLFAVVLGFIACGPSEEEKIAQAKSMLQEGNNDGALVLLNEIISDYPDNQAAYNMRGITKLEKGFAMEAIADLDISVSLDSTDYRAYYNRGNAYYQLEKYKEAIRDFDRASRLEPKEADIYINRGNALVQLEDYRNAIPEYKFALKLEEDNYMTHFNLGRTYYLTEERDLAKVSFEKCLQIYATFAPAYYFLGMISLEDDDVESSCLFMKQAADLGYKQADEVMKIYCDPV